MSANSSSNSSLDPHFYHRCDSKASSAFVTTKTVLLLHLSVLVLYLGHQRRRQQRSPMSHSDVFTCHLVAMELMGVSGSPFYFYGSYADLPEMTKVGFCLSSISLAGEISFHILTCVERYLAVVHPVTYLGLKQAGGVRIRNISTGCVWLLCFGWCGVNALYFPKLPVIAFCCLLIFSFIVVSVCSLSVLCVLIRPGPGEVGGDRERVDQSKQRAFNTITAIMGVLWLWFVGYLACLGLGASPLLSNSDRCLVLIAGFWFSLPSSLVLPLLFLHRAGKLPFCSYNTD